MVIRQARGRNLLSTLDPASAVCPSLLLGALPAAFDSHTPRSYELVILNTRLLHVFKITSTEGVGVGVKFLNSSFALRAPLR